MKRTPYFLTVEEVLEIHAGQIERYGGRGDLRDAGLLESAVAMPHAWFEGEYLHGNLFDMAAAYAFHIAQNQPFLDGNKRTGLLAALVFLDLNGAPLLAPSPKLYLTMIDIAEGRLDKAGLAEVFRALADEESRE